MAGGSIKGVLLDIGGVVYVGSEALSGAVEAVRRLQRAGLALRYLTNTTRTPRRGVLAKLRGFGLGAGEDELFMPAVAARHYLETQGLSPHLLIHPALEEDFAGLTAGQDEAVVVGDAAEGFTYEALNSCFRKLEAGAAFLALAKNRSFQDADGALSLDVGAFAAALEYASGREALVLGKPSPDFFLAAVESLGCAPDEAVMIGDDVEADVGGAMAAGLLGVLVKTGKYRDGDERRIDPPPSALADDLSAAIDWILARRG
ncbi:MAG: TIGR01458 family HAD-type hydrolase [Kiloniellales bacterium]